MKKVFTLLTVASVFAFTACSEGGEEATTTDESTKVEEVIEDAEEVIEEKTEEAVEVADSVSTEVEEAVEAETEEHDHAEGEEHAH